MKRKRLLYAILAAVIAVVTLANLVGCKPGAEYNTPTSGATSSASSGATSSASSGATSGASSGGREDPTGDVTPVLTGGGKQAFEHGVMGKGVGINPGRVTWAYAPGVFTWNGAGYWWNITNFDTEKVRTMLLDSLYALTNTDSEAAAWRALFEYTDTKRGVEKGYRKGDGIAIKLNMNGCNSLTGGTNILFSSPVFLRELLESMVRAGVEPGDITVFDCTRVIPSPMTRYCSAGIARGVNFKYGEECLSGAEIVWSSDEVKGEKSYIPDFVVSAKYFLNLSGMKGHDLAGMTATGKNLFGAFITESNRSASPWAAGLHELVAAHYYSSDYPGRDMGTYNPIVDLMCNAYMGQKTVLYVAEAFVCTPKQNAEVDPRTCKWEIAPFNGDWTSSLIMSQDPVAIDSVCCDFMNAEPSVARNGDAIDPNSTMQNYLHEAAQIPAPASGTDYRDGKGNSLKTSPGVHEHWADANTKQYSRNLGKSEGIELYKMDYSK